MGDGAVPELEAIASTSFARGNATGMKRDVVAPMDSMSRLAQPVTVSSWLGVINSLNALSVVVESAPP